MSQQRHRTPKSVVAKARRLLMEGRVDDAVDALDEVASYRNAQELLGQVRHRILHDLTAQHIETAREAIDQGQIISAESILNQILELEPSHQDALGLLQELSELRPAEVPWDEALGAATSPPIKSIEADRALLDRVDALLVTEPEPRLEEPRPRPPAPSHEIQPKAADEPTHDSELPKNPTVATPLEPPGLAPTGLGTDTKAAEAPPKTKVASAPAGPKNLDPAPPERNDRRSSSLGFAPVHEATESGPSHLDDMPLCEPGIDEVSIRSAPTTAASVPSSIAVAAQSTQNVWLPRVALALAALALLLVLAQQFRNPARPAPPQPDPAAGPQIPEPLETRVLVSTTETGLKVWKDGEDLDLETPANVILQGVPGERVLVELRRDGKPVAQARWTIGRDVPSNWEPKIAPPPPEPEPLKILSEPSGARIVLDGTEVGITPTTVEVLPTQEHTLELHLDGHETAARSLIWKNLTGAQRSAGEVTVRLQAKTGRLVVSAPYSVRLFVDEVDRGVVKTLNLKPGQYTVSAVAPAVFYFGQPRPSAAGTRGAPRSITIEAGKDFVWSLPTTVTVQLIPDPSNCVIWIDQERVIQSRQINPLPITVGRHHFRFFWPDQGQEQKLFIDIKPSTRTIPRTIPTG